MEEQCSAINLKINPVNYQVDNFAKIQIMARDIYNYPNNLSILNISTFSNLYMFWDVKILRT